MVFGGSLLACRVPLEDCDDRLCIDADVGEDVGWQRLAGSDVGSLWMSWVHVDATGARKLWVGQMDAASGSWRGQWPVPTAAAPTVGSSEKPAFAVHNGRVLLAYTGAGLLRHGDATAAYVQMATIDDSGLRADPPILVDDTSGGAYVLEHIQATFTSSGEPWVVWKTERFGEEDQWFSAIVRDTIHPVEIAVLPSNAHECSPPGFGVTASGVAHLALRSQVDGFRETFVVSGSDGAFEQAHRVSDDQWPYSPLFCPTDGPRLGAHDDDRALVGWVAPDANERPTVRWSPGHLEEAGWATPSPMPMPEGLGERWPTVVPTSDGGWWTSVERLEQRTDWQTRDSAGNVLSSGNVLSPDGEPLLAIEPLAVGDRVFVAGQTTAGRLWFVEMTP